MPELPDLEVIREFLAPRIVGVPIVSAQVRRPIIVRNLLGGDMADPLEASESRQRPVSCHTRTRRHNTRTFPCHILYGNKNNDQCGMLPLFVLLLAEVYQRSSQQIPLESLEYVHFLLLFSKESFETSNNNMRFRFLKKL